MTELTATFKPVDNETWEAACELAAYIVAGFGGDASRRYYTKEGERLRALHEVVDAIVRDDLIVIHMNGKIYSKSLADIGKIGKIKAQESPLLTERVYRDIQAK